MKTQNLTVGQVLKNYKELCSVLDIKAEAGNSKKAQLKELNRYVNYHKEGNKFIIDEIYEVIQQKSGRSDKGLTRDEYNTIKEHFKPLIYNVLLTKPNFVHTATFNNWLKETGLVKDEFIKERARVQDDCFYNDFTKDFITVESDSLRRCFTSALDSMSKSKQGKVSWYKKKIAINLDGEHIELGEGETAEIDNIEQELYNLFEITSRNELIYRSRKELREFDTMLREILIDRYKYSTCYTAYQVIARLGVKEETINKNLEEAKKKYGLVDNMQKALTTCKDTIYDSRLKRAESRFTERLAKRDLEVNAKYDEQLIDNWGDDDFVEFLREIELSDCYSLESYIDQWINHYKKYIHNKK
ncbi:MAG: hypothetical protein RRZ84_02715 [Romboutsia sp.]